MTNEEVIARARELRPLIYQNIQQDVDERGVLVLFTEAEPYKHYAFVRFVEDMETTDATDHNTLEWLSLSDKLFDAYEALIKELTPERVQYQVFENATEWMTPIEIDRELNRLGKLLAFSHKAFDQLTEQNKLAAEKTEILQSFRETIITSAERFFSVFETGDKEVPEFAAQEWMNLGMALRFYLEEGGEIE